eukprot:SAG22_NODE_13400_length_408_cov_0.818770_1_plen_87_part_01
MATRAPFWCALAAMCLATIFAAPRMADTKTLQQSVTLDVAPAFAAISELAIPALSKSMEQLIGSYSVSIENVGNHRQLQTAPSASLR